MEPLRRIQDFEKVKLLADARRMAILQLLMAGPWTLSQLGLALSEHPAQVRHHLKLLEDAGLVELTATHVVRGFIEKYYRARAQAFLIQELILPATPVQPYQGWEAERKTTIAMGSHDLALELLFNELQEQNSGMSFLALPVGSLDGLVALRQGIAHLAGSHLWDAANGEYNLPHVRYLFPDRAMLLATLTHRRQGLILAQGNPRRIFGLEDLARPEVTLVHRNRGSGTRVWLERALGQAGISPQQVHAYPQEVRTHTELALVIARGRADVGLGLQAAAVANNLDFVPLFEERYDLVIPQDQIDSQGIQIILAGLGNKAFRRRVGEMAGYNPSQMGETVVV